MSSLNENIVLKYLVENVDPGLVKQYSINVVLALDYCYKNGERIPKDYISDMASRVVSKKTNTSSRNLEINESNMMDCFFIEHYTSLLSNSVKGLVKEAKTTKDFKGIILIDLLSKKVKDYPRVLSSNTSLDSKIFNLAKACKSSVLENTFNKDYNKLRELSLMVNSELNKPLDTEVSKYLQKVRKDLVSKLEVYSKRAGEEYVHEIQNLIVSMRNSIDHKFSNYLYNVNQHYERIKDSFENSIWDNEKRINNLIGLKSEIGSVKHAYQMALSKEGMGLCEDLENKMQNVIDAYYNLRYVLEDFKSIKTEVKDYYPEVDHIFSESTSPSRINRLNEIYSRLNNLVNVRFPDYIPSEKQNDYYSRLNDLRGYIQQKCAQRVTYLVEKSAKYRHKSDNAFFSFRAKKFKEELEIYNNELKEWSKCQVLEEI